MEKNGVQICNVCLASSEDGAKRVYVKAVCGGEEVHVCTACLPTVIHQSADAVKSNEEVKKALGL